MPKPVFVDCIQDDWTLVATDIKGGNLNRSKSDAFYSWTYTDVGEGKPIASVVGVLIFDKDDNEKIPLSAGMDLYVFCQKDSGRVRVDALTSFQDVALQDQITPTVIVNFNQVHDSTTLASEALINQRDIVVNSATGIVVGSYIILFSPTTQRFYFGKATIISGDPTITLDTPLDSTFPAGTFVDIAITDMSVNGLVSPQTFGLRGIGAPPGVDIKVDITRILFTCIADSAVSASLFANLTALLNGLILRKRNGTNRNIFNVKTNREMAGIMFDFDPSAATNPQQGEDGFKTRFTIERTGVVVRLPIGEDLEIIIQDNLLGITVLECIAEGHIVED